MHGSGLLIPGLPLPIGVRRVSTGASPTFPLDGVSGVTGAWSMSRKLLSSYAGSFYTDAGGGAISAILEQSSGVSDRNLTDGGTSTRRPALTTAGPNSVAMADFDGTSDNLSTVQATSNFVTASEGVMLWAGIIDAFTLNNGTTYLNDLLLGDTGQFMGLYARNTGGGTVYAYNWDTADRKDTVASVGTGTAVVLSWRHKSGNVFAGLNGTEGAGAASGNTGALTGTLRLGGDSSARFADVKFSEAVALNADPGAVTLAAIITDLLAHM